MWINGCQLCRLKALHVATNPTINLLENAGPETPAATPVSTNIPTPTASFLVRYLKSFGFVAIELKVGKTGELKRL